MPGYSEFVSEVHRETQQCCSAAISSFTVSSASTSNGDPETEWSFYLRQQTGRAHVLHTTPGGWHNSPAERDSCDALHGQPQLLCFVGLCRHKVCPYICKVNA